MNKVICCILVLLTLANKSFLYSKEANIIFKDGVEIYKYDICSDMIDGVAEKFSVKLPRYKNALFFASRNNGFDGINQHFSWPTSRLSSLFDESFKQVPTIDKPVNCGVLLVLELMDGSYAAVQPIATNKLMGWIEVVDDETISIVCGSMGTEKVKEDGVPVFAYGKNRDFYSLMYSIWNDISSDDKIKNNLRLRKEKIYPEPFEYLGWCTWEHFRKNFNEKVLTDALNTIENSDIPVRWILVDDGHQIQENGKLKSFDINPKLFPNSWSPIMSKRSDKIRWFGLWHCMYGLWGGISEKHNMPYLNNYLMKNKRNRLILNGTKEAADVFYNKLVSSASDKGFDFVKIDVQTRDFNNYLMTCNAVEAHSNNADALEYYAHKKLDGLMNCMAQNLPCVFNTKYSATTRVSVDYKLNDISKARNHIYQGFQNTIWMGHTVWPDHDMFHSSDKTLGRLMAVSKAMSAAPIYLSDAPADFVKEYITPLTYKDGRILRPQAPGVPLPKSIFNNALMGDCSYQVISPLSEHSAAIVAYNVSNTNMDILNTEVTEEDYSFADAMSQPYKGRRNIPSEGLVFYDWYHKKGGKLEKKYSFSLSNMEDCLILLCEIDKGWSVVGLENKYMSPAGIESYTADEKKLTLTLNENGNFIIYSDMPIVKCENGVFENLGNGLWRILPKSNSNNFIIYRD